MLLTLAAALLLQTPVPPSVVPRPAPPPRPREVVFDSPATRALVERVIRESGEVPAELRDFEAQVRTTMQLSLAPDSSLGGELPITVDELAGEIRWRRPDVLHQWVREHRTRVLVPAPYSLGTFMETPWVIPHLYGPTIEVLTLSAGAARRGGAPAAIHPFSLQGPLYYRYQAGDTVRIRIQDEQVSLVPITVLPRAPWEGGPPQPLVVGTFYIDVARAAVAQARFGFVEPRRGLALGRAGVFLELENGLWDNRYWLPFRQRREVQVASSLFGGAVGARIVNTLTGYRINTGWEPQTAGRLRLFQAAPPPEPSFGPAAPGVAEAATYDIADFADLRRLSIEAGRRAPGTVRLGLRYERGDHFFRYNRVEGAFLGLGARLEPGNPLERRWEIYGTGGWAFAEGTPRGELIARWHFEDPRVPPRGLDRGVSAGAYRRLRDTRAFHPTFQWDWLYTLPAAIGGSDLRDYFDATGGELGFAVGAGRWRARLTGRAERQDSVTVNTERFLFGTADEFPPLAAVEPGTHAALEVDGGYARGSGAFGMGNSTVAALRLEAGFGDFATQRVLGLLSFRRTLEPVTLAARFDAAHAFGAPPPQMLFRFGQAEGLSGFGVNEFGGSSAAVARTRLLLGLPPRELRPLARSGPFFIPPLRPALVLLGEAGWSEVSSRARPQLDRLGARVTDGVRASWGIGLSIFDDALAVEWIRPLDDDRDDRWYVGIARWF